MRFCLRLITQVSMRQWPHISFLTNDNWILFYLYPDEMNEIESYIEHIEEVVDYSFLARMADRFPVTAWKPVLMLCTEHLEWQVMHWRKKRRTSLLRMVSGERQVWQNTYSLMYFRSTVSMFLCWNLPFRINWLEPSMVPTVPNSACRKASKCLGWRWSLLLR